MTLLLETLRRIVRVICVTLRSLFLTAASSSDTPVKVYILLGQSNMLGMGAIGNEDSGDGSLYCACHEKGLYQYLLTGEQWKTRHDVRYVFTMASALDEGKLVHNEWMTVTGGRIGPELGIGHEVRSHEFGSGDSRDFSFSIDRKQ